MVTLKNWRAGPGFKKYSVDVDGKPVSFGDKRYEHYQDNTPLKLYSSQDHLDPARRRLYRLRHQHNKGIASKLAQIYLW
jgi:hypothetical protein